MIRRRSIAKANLLEACQRLAYTVTGLVAVFASSLAMAKVENDEWPVRLRQDLGRLSTIEWKLRSAAGGACPTAGSDFGLGIDDRRDYLAKDWPLLARSVGLADKPVIAAVVGNSPGDRAGLRIGDAIISINGVSAENLARVDYAGPASEAVLGHLAGLPAGSPAAIIIRRDDAYLAFTVTPTSHCAVHFVLKTSESIDAYSDTANLAVTTGLLAFARTDDELALVAGHELAHILLRHSKSAGLRQRRKMEDDADLEGARLAFCAGYDVAAATAFFDRYAEKDFLSFLRAPTHRSFRQRAKRIRAASGDLRC